MNDEQVMFELLAIPSGPGSEQPMASTVQRLFRAYTDDIKEDTLGNVIAKVAGEGLGRHPRIMLGAHMDEIALMVSTIEPGGFLRLVPTGSFDPRTLIGQEVTVHGRTALCGVIGTKPPHLTSAAERKQAPGLDDLFIDVAMDESEVFAHVSIGDRITLRQSPGKLLNGRFFGKSLDNRTSILIELACLDFLRTLRHVADVYSVATVQEEVGLRGATTAAYAIRPDIAIAIDVTWAQMPGQPEDVSFAMGEGPVLVFGPNIHPKVFQALKDTATKHHIPWQLEVSEGPTATDGAAFQIAGDGIATGVLGISIRYMHTSVETGCMEDIRETGRLLAHFIADVDAKFVEGLTCY